MVDNGRQTIGASLGQFKADPIGSFGVEGHVEFALEEAFGDTAAPLEVPCQCFSVVSQRRTLVAFVIDESLRAELFDHLGYAGATHFQTGRQIARCDTITPGQRTPQESTEVLATGTGDWLFFERNLRAIRLTIGHGLDLSLSIRSGGCDVVAREHYVEPANNLSEDVQ